MSILSSMIKKNKIQTGSIVSRIQSGIRLGTKNQLLIQIFLKYKSWAYPPQSEYFDKWPFMLIIKQPKKRMEMVTGR